MLKVYYNWVRLCIIGKSCLKFKLKKIKIKKYILIEIFIIIEIYYIKFVCY